MDITQAPDDGLSTSRERVTLFWVLIAAGIVRLIALWQTAIIAKDGTVYIQNALHFMRGEFAQGMQTYPPVYSMLIALTSALTDNAERSAQCVSAILGTLSLVPFYGLTRGLFGRQVALVSALLFTFHPFLAQHSGEAIAEATYIFFFLSTLYVGWQGWDTGRVRYFLAFGLLSALAYLTRPEGIGLIAGLGLWMAAGGWRRRNARGRALCVRFLVVLIPWMILVAPYLLHVRATTGEWRINAKRDMVADSGLSGALQSTSERPAEPYPGFMQPENVLAWVGRYFKTLFFLVVKFSGVLHPILLVFLLYCATTKAFFSFHRDGEAFLLFFAVLYLAALSLLYVSGRHLLQIVPLVLPWVAAGLLACAKRLEWLMPKMNAIGWRWSAPTLLVVLTLTILLPKTLAPHRADKLSLKEAGQWIGSQREIAPFVLSTDARISFYAQGRHVALPHPERIARVIQARRPDFVALETDQIGPLAAFIAKTRGPWTLKEVYRTPAQRGRLPVIVYRRIKT